MFKFALSLVVAAVMMFSASGCGSHKDPLSAMSTTQSNVTIGSATQLTNVAAKPTVENYLDDFNTTIVPITHGVPLPEWAVYGWWLFISPAVSGKSPVWTPLPVDSHHGFARFNIAQNGQYYAKVLMASGKEYLFAPFPLNVGHVNEVTLDIDNVRATIFGPYDSFMSTDVGVTKLALPSTTLLDGGTSNTKILRWAITAKSGDRFMSNQKFLLKLADVGIDNVGMFSYIDSGYSALDTNFSPTGVLNYGYNARIVCIPNSDFYMVTIQVSKEGDPYGIYVWGAGITRYFELRVTTTNVGWTSRLEIGLPDFPSEVLTDGHDEFGARIHAQIAALQAQIQPLNDQLAVTMNKEDRLKIQLQIQMVNLQIELLKEQLGIPVPKG